MGHSIFPTPKSLVRVVIVSHSNILATFGVSYVDTGHMGHMPGVTIIMPGVNSAPSSESLGALE